MFLIAKYGQLSKNVHSCSDSDNNLPVIPSSSVCVLPKKCLQKSQRLQDDKGQPQLLVQPWRRIHPGVFILVLKLLVTGWFQRKIIERYGYPFENHQLVTPDGYILNMYRVPHNGSDPYRKRPPIFLQHGFASDSSTWLMLGQQSSGMNFA